MSDKDILDDGEIVPDLKREYLTARMREFKSLRDDWSEVFPVEKIGPSTPGYPNLKCRGTWFVTIMNELLNLVDRKIIEDSEEVAKIEEFHRYVEGLDFTEGGRTTPEDVKTGNEILDYFLSRYPVE